MHHIIVSKNATILKKQSYTFLKSGRLADNKAKIHIKSEEHLLEAALALIQAGALIDDLSKSLILGKNAKGVTVLQLALDENNWRCVKTIASAITPQIFTEELADSVTEVLSIALLETVNKANQPEAVEAALALLSAGAKPTRVYSPSQNSSLHLAAQHGNAELCLALIKAGADLNKKNSKNQSALDFAVFFNRWQCITETAKYIVGQKKPAKFTEILSRALICTVNKADQPEAAEAALALLSAGAKPNLVYGSSQNSSLHLAAKHGNAELCLALLKEDDVLTRENSDDQTALDLAVLHNRWSCISVIVKYIGRQDPYEFLEDIIDTALLDTVNKANQPEAVEAALALLSAGAKPTRIYSSSQNSSLHLAAKHGNAELCLALLKAGADLTEKNSDQQSALDLAVSNNQWLVMITIAEYIFQNKILGTPIHALRAALLNTIQNAIETKTIETAQRLLDNYCPPQDDDDKMAEIPLPKPFL